MHTLAFVVWNVGTRPPLTLIADLRLASRDRRMLVTVAGAGIVGLIFVVAGSVLVAPLVPNVPAIYATVETFFVMVALGIEMLVGETVRAAVGIRATR